MGRQPSVEQQEALRLFLDSDGEMPLVEIARRVGKKDGQIRKWKSTNKWDDKLAEKRAGKGNVPVSNGNVTESSKGNVTKTEPDERSGSPPSKGKRGAPPGNANAKGHGAPIGNTNAVGNSGPRHWQNDHAVTHGFFQKHLPESLHALIEEISEKGPVEIAWENVCISYAKIIRGLSVMDVGGPDDNMRLVKKKRWELGGNDPEDGEEPPQMEVLSEIEFEHHTAHDRYASSLNSLARMQSELRSHMKFFLEISGEDDKRRLELATMEANLEKTRAEIEKIKSGDGAGEGVQIIDDIGDDFDGD